MIRSPRLALIRPLMLAASLFAMAGCNNSDTPVGNEVSEPTPSSPAAPELNLCTSPRPEMCTQEYNPVCATLADGSMKTYSTGCTACSDANVAGWLPGECD